MRATPSPSSAARRIPVVVESAPRPSHTLTQHTRTLRPLPARPVGSRSVGRHGGDFTTAALDILVAASGGYPYFLQEFGKAVWNLAPGSPFTEEDSLLAVDARPPRPRRRVLPLALGPSHRPRTPLPARDRHHRRGATPIRTGAAAPPPPESATSATPRSRGPRLGPTARPDRVHRPRHGRIHPPPTHRLNSKSTASVRPPGRDRTFMSTRIETSCGCGVAEIDPHGCEPQSDYQCSRLERGVATTRSGHRHLLTLAASNCFLAYDVPILTSNYRLRATKRSSSKR